MPRSAHADVRAVRSAIRKPIRLGLAIERPRWAAGVSTRDVRVAIGRTRLLVLELVVEASPVHPLEHLKPIGFTDDGPVAPNARPRFVSHADMMPCRRPLMPLCARDQAHANAAGRAYDGIPAGPS
jgi:hypothetical protein